MMLPMLQPLLLGMDWMEPEYLLDRFGTELLWVSLVMIFVECGLFFPFLPGDTLLLRSASSSPPTTSTSSRGNHFVELVIALVLLTAAAMLGNVAGYEIGRAARPAARRSATAGS